MNKKKIYTIVFALFFCICLFGYIWSWFVTRNIDKEAKEVSNQEQKVKIKDLILTESKEGVLQWELYAKEGNYVGSDKNVVLNDAIGNFYNEKGEVELSFRADKGTYVEATKSVVIEGNALAVVKDGTSIRADRVLWTDKSDYITAKGNVVINHNNELITKSDGASFNTNMTHIKIEGNTESKIYQTSEVKQ